MARYLIINDATRVVETVALWDGKPGWAPPAGYSAELETTPTSAGAVKSGNTFLPPQAKQPEPDYAKAQAALDLVAMLEAAGGIDKSVADTIRAQLGG